MALKYADRVAESTVTVGTGEVFLAGPIDADHDAFASQFADTETMPVVVFGGGKWMTFEGRYNSGANSITRINFRDSSTGAPISLSGTMTVMCAWGAVDAQAVLRIDFAQSLSAAQQAQALQNVGLDINQRVNTALDRIYQSKLLAAYRRVVNSLADGYKVSDGINSGASSNYTVTTGATPIDVNVATSLGAGTTVTINAQSTTLANQGNTYIDRTTALVSGVLVTKIGMYSTTARSVTLKIAKRNSANNYDFVVSQTFSHTGTGFEDFVLSAPYTVPATGAFYLGSYVPAGGSDPNVTIAVNRAYVTVSNTTGTGVTSSGEDSGAVHPLRYVHSIVFNNMTLVTATQTADGSVSNGRVLLEFDNSGAPILNTDLTAEVTCNGGTTWTAAALSAVTTYSQGGRKVAETVDQACTGGTSFAARIKTLNNKNIPIYGLSLTVH